MDGELLLIIIVGVVLFFTIFMWINTIKYSNKQAKIEKEKKKKDVQPVADVSPKQVDFEKDLTAGTPLNVDDPIFTKKQYENITERSSLQALIEEEKQKDNLEIVSKLRNIEITDVPVEDEYNDMVSDGKEVEPITIIEEPVMEMSKEKEEEPKAVDNKPKKEVKQTLSQTATLAQAIEKIKQLNSKK